jgi:diguanylate cyclase (GGDEF)-like protein
VSPTNASHGPDSPRDRSILRRAALRDAARTAQARDLLLIHARGADDLTVVEGLICGEHWAGPLQLDLSVEPLVAQALAGDEIVRNNPPSPRRVCGPFWSTSAAFVPWHSADDSIVAMFGVVGLEVPDTALRDAADAARELVPRVAAGDDALLTLRALDDVLRSSSDSVPEAMERLADGARAALRSDAVVVWVNEGHRAVGRAGTWPIDQVDAVAATVADICLAGGEPDLARRLEATTFTDPTMPAWRDVTVIDLPEIGKLVSLALPRRTQRGPRHALQSRVATVGTLVLGTALTRERLSWHADHARSLMHRDALTGLLNREGWQHALRRLANEDADHIHTVLRIEVAPGPAGDARGERELAQVASALAASSRTGDVVARVGARELCLLVHEIDAEAATAPEVAARVRDRLARIAPHLHGRVSIGWAVAENARAIVTALGDASAQAHRSHAC